jgi:hypothetical protein
MAGKLFASLYQQASNIQSLKYRIQIQTVNVQYPDEKTKEIDRSLSITCETQPLRSNSPEQPKVKQSKSMSL